MIRLIQLDSIFETLAHRACHEPDRCAMIFVHEDGHQETVSAGQQHRRAMASGAALRDRGIGRGDVVVVLLRHSRELVDVLWGLLSVGAVPAIFPYLTEKLDPEIYRRQIERLVTSAGAAALATSSNFEQEASLLADLAGCRVVVVDGIGVSDSPTPFEPVPTTGDAACFIQYSSGTTGMQKGVVHSHGDLLAGLAAITKAVDIRPDDVIVTWLPLFHDFGIVCGFLLPMLHGIPIVFMSPFYWLRNPKSLLELIDRYRGTVTFMPNFAFNHCVRSIRSRDVEGLDLSCWRVALNSSELARVDTMRSFVDRFGPYGFSESALMVGYGTTECMGITMTPADREPGTDWIDLRVLQSSGRAVSVDEGSPGSFHIASCGFNLETVAVRIVDTEGREVGDRRVGEILVRSPFSLKEYHRQPELTARSLSSGWFHTGDLGYRHRGELFVCGRIKDVINSGGRIIHTEDLEEIANKVPGIHPGRSVAFGVLDDRTGTEGIAMVCELRHQCSDEQQIDVERELRRRLVSEMEVTLVDLHLLDVTGWVIKTSNGKIARGANRTKYLELLARGPFKESHAVVPWRCE